MTGDRVEEFEEAVTDATDLIVLESPSSSVLFPLQDIRARVPHCQETPGAGIHRQSVLYPLIHQQPLDMGADIVMHTTSKYIGGHSDIIGVYAGGKCQELMKKLTADREPLGGIVALCEAWLMIRACGPWRSGWRHCTRPQPWR